jgi:hypothetical protein
MGPAFSENFLPERLQQKEFLCHTNSTSQSSQMQTIVVSTNDTRITVTTNQAVYHPCHRPVMLPPARQYQHFISPAIPALPYPRAQVKEENVIRIQDYTRKGLTERELASLVAQIAHQELEKEKR